MCCELRIWAACLLVFAQPKNFIHKSRWTCWSLNLTHQKFIEHVVRSVQKPNEYLWCLCLLVYISFCSSSTFVHFQFATRKLCKNIDMHVNRYNNFSLHLHDVFKLLMITFHFSMECFADLTTAKDGGSHFIFRSFTKLARNAAQCHNQNLLI